MYDELFISFKITNWCNLHCNHCCERSGCHEQTNFMPLKKLDRYLTESKDLMFIPDELVCLGGGEAMAPYMHKNMNYIPNALDLIYSHKYVPTIKTNGTWGEDDNLRKRILSDISAKAYKYDKLVTLDISVDEFHNNKNGVVKIISDIISSSELGYAIRFCLVGFDTPASIRALDNIQQELQKLGFHIRKTMANDWIIEDADGDFGLYVCNDYVSKIYDLGRAKQTKVYNSEYGPNLWYESYCFQIDNKDNAILNYLYREQIKNRTLDEVLYSLIQQQKRR